MTSPCALCCPCALNAAAESNALLRDAPLWIRRSFVRCRSLPKVPATCSADPAWQLLGQPPYVILLRAPKGGSDVPSLSHRYDYARFHVERGRSVRPSHACSGAAEPPLFGGA